MKWFPRLLYSVLPGVLLAALLIAWAQATADVVRIPPVASPALGIGIAVIGTALIWRLVAQPLLIGFCIFCIGASIATGSASGLWLVSPMVILCCAALVLSGVHPTTRPVMPMITEGGEGAPSRRERCALYLFLLVPWLALYEAVLAIGVPPDAISGLLPFERHLPVIEWSQIFYGSTYLMALTAPLFAKTRTDLRRFNVRGLWTMAVAYPLFVLVPLISPKRAFVPNNVPGHLLRWEQSLDSSVAAFPSFHVIWSLLAAEVFAQRWPRLRWMFYGWAVMVGVSCVTTGQHSILDVLGGAGTVALVVCGPQLWRAACACLERIDRSCREWRFGPASVTSEGIYAGVCGLVAIWAAETLAGGSVRIAVVAAPLWGAGFWLAPATLGPGRSERGSLDGESGRLSALICKGAIAAILVRLWTLCARLHLIAGIGLMLFGITAFAGYTGMRENGMRAFVRPTPRQWVAVAAVIGGACVTTLGPGVSAPSPIFELVAFVHAGIAGLAIAIGTGVRFAAEGRQARIPELQ